MGKRARTCCVYAVAVGRTVGVFETWDECGASVNFFSGPLFRGFDSRAEAEAWLLEQRHAAPLPTQTPSCEIKRPPGIQTRSPIDVIDVDDDEACTAPATQAMPPLIAVPAPHTATNVQHRLVLYADGSCVKNGFPGAFGGYGVFYGENDPRNIALPLHNDEPQTNNRAEMRACMTALAQHPTDSLEVRTDSVYCIDGITKWLPNWKRNGWRKQDNTPIANLDLWKEFDLLLQQRPATACVKFTHVRGHAGEPGNEAADKLAVAGAMLSELNPARRELQRPLPMPTTDVADPAAVTASPLIAYSFAVARSAETGGSTQQSQASSPKAPLIAAPICPHCNQPARRLVSGPTTKRPNTPFYNCQCGGPFFKWESDVVVAVPQTKAVAIRARINHNHFETISLVTTATGETKISMSFPFQAPLVRVIKQLSPLHRAYDSGSMSWVVRLSALNSLLDMMTAEKLLDDTRMQPLVGLMHLSADAAEKEKAAAGVSSTVRAVSSSMPIAIAAAYPPSTLPAEDAPAFNAIRPPHHLHDSYSEDDFFDRDGNSRRDAATNSGASQSWPQRCYGKFQCSKCKHEWTSAYTWEISANLYEEQQCRACNHEQHPYTAAPIKPGLGGGGPHDSSRCGMCRSLGRNCSVYYYV